MAALAVPASGKMAKAIKEICRKPSSHWVGDGFHVYPVFANKVCACMCVCMYASLTLSLTLTLYTPFPSTSYHHLHHYRRLSPMPCHRS